MVLKLFNDKRTLAAAAAEQAATAIVSAIADHGKARIIAATGASQFEFLEALTRLSGIDWKKVEMFHLDEYIGLPESHPASFSNYLQDFEWPESLEVELPGGSRSGDVPAV